MPTIDIPDKICKHCGGTKWYFSNVKSHILYCFLLRKETVKASYEKHKSDPYIIASKKARLRKWKDNNREHIRAYEIDYNKKSNVKLECRRRSAKKMIDNLEDQYIKSLLIAKSPVKLSKKDIPQKLIELERSQLLLKRKLNMTNYEKK